MKKLFLIRHGEAGFMEGTDFQRQLTKAGIEKVKRVSLSLKNKQAEVDFMYCSPAQRTQETAQILGEQILIRAYDFQRSIYEGDLAEMIKMLENTPDLIHSCLVVGHNPIISLLLSSLTDHPYQNMSPGTLAEVELEIDSWKMIGAGIGILREVIN